MSPDGSALAKLVAGKEDGALVPQEAAVDEGRAAICCPALARATRVADEIAFDEFCVKGRERCHAGEHTAGSRCRVALKDALTICAAAGYRPAVVGVVLGKRAGFHKRTAANSTTIIAGIVNEGAVSNYIRGLQIQS